MYYKYKCGEETLDIEVNKKRNNNIDAKVIKDGNVFLRTVDCDQQGKYIRWNKGRIYLDNWIRTTLLEIQEKIDDNEILTEEDITRAIISEGVDNVKFLCPMGSKSDRNKSLNKVCKIKETCSGEVEVSSDLKLEVINSTEGFSDNKTLEKSEFVDLLLERVIRIVM